MRDDAPVAIELDQDVDPAAIAPFLRIETEQHKRVAFKMIARAEADPLWARNPNLVIDGRAPCPAGSTAEGRCGSIDGKRLGAHHVIVAPVTTWPPGTNLRIALGKGAPSREGPRRSTRESIATFEVAPRFTFTQLTCDSSMHRVSAASACPVRSTMLVDPVLQPDRCQVAYRSSLVQLDRRDTDARRSSHRRRAVRFHRRAIDGRRSHAGRGIRSTSTRFPSTSVARYGHHDRRRPRRRRLGQEYTGPHHVSFTTTLERVDPRMWVEDSGLYILDPRFEIPQWSVLVEGVGSLHVELYAVKPAETTSRTKRTNAAKALDRRRASASPTRCIRSARASRETRVSICAPRSTPGCRGTC